MNKLQFFAVLIAAFIGSYLGSVELQTARADLAAGNGSGVALQSTSPPTQQTGGAGVTGQMAAGIFAIPVPSSVPAPTVSGSPAAYFALSGAGASNSLRFQTSKDHGTSTFIDAQFWYNNQGTGNIAAQINGDGSYIMGTGQVQALGLPSPAPPAPTCAPFGSNAQTTYYVQTNYVSATGGVSASSAEASVTCAASTVLVVPAPSPVAASAEWTVSAATTTGQEKNQTQGTPTGTNIPLATTLWTSTATLAGSTAASVYDHSLLQSFTAQDANGTTYLNFDPEGTSYVRGPFEVSTKAQTVSATPNPASYVPPMYLAAGTATASTEHCVVSPSAGLAGATGTQTVTLTGAAAFAAADYFLEIYNVTTPGAIAPTAQAAGSFAFTGVTGQTYSYLACGD